jgi:hypothetical protein
MGRAPSSAGNRTVRALDVSTCLRPRRPPDRGRRRWQPHHQSRQRASPIVEIRRQNPFYRYWGRKTRRFRMIHTAGGAGNCHSHAYVSYICMARCFPAFFSRAQFSRRRLKSPPSPEGYAPCGITTAQQCILSTASANRSGSCSCSEHSPSEPPSCAGTARGIRISEPPFRRGSRGGGLNRCAVVGVRAASCPATQPPSRRYPPRASRQP